MYLAGVGLKTWQQLSLPPPRHTTSVGPPRVLLSSSFSNEEAPQWFRGYSFSFNHFQASPSASPSESPYAYRPQHHSKTTCGSKLRSGVQDLQCCSPNLLPTYLLCSGHAGLHALNLPVSGPPLTPLPNPWMFFLLLFTYSNSGHPSRSTSCSIFSTNFSKTTPAIQGWAWWEAACVQRDQLNKNARQSSKLLQESCLSFPS